MAVLDVQDVHVSFGGVKALQGVGMELQDREILAVIGPNGAGKTTLINCISGWYHPNQGTVHLNGQDITQLPTAHIAKLGISRTFQNIALFRGMTVLDNIMTGAHIHMKSNFITSAIYWGPAQREEVRYREAAEDIIDFLEIEHIRKSMAGAIPMGDRKSVV